MARSSFRKSYKQSNIREGIYGSIIVSDQGEIPILYHSLRILKSMTGFNAYAPKDSEKYYKYGSMWSIIEVEIGFDSTFPQNPFYSPTIERSELVMDRLDTYTARITTYSLNKIESKGQYVYQITIDLRKKE